MRPAWLEIDLAAIDHNLSLIRDLVGPGVGVVGVVKSNAYGHGAVEVARRLASHGVTALAVALVQEGVALREAGIEGPLLVMGATDVDEAPLFVEHTITPAVSRVEFAQALSQAAGDLGTTASCHVKLDTGMGRQGVRAEQAGEFGAALRALPHLSVDGVFSHFAASPSDREFTITQIEAFTRAVALLEAGLGTRIPLRHLANSGGVLRHPEAHLDAVRPGALLYGIAAHTGGEHHPATRQAMSLKARIVATKDMRAGESVGYSRSYVVLHDTRTAILPLGYADGYPRALSNNADVLLRGRRCPVVGRVSMDCVVIDVGGLEGVAAGEEVVLLGCQGEAMITTGELAERCGTCVEEIVARMGTRLPRVFVDNAD